MTNNISIRNHPIVLLLTVAAIAILFLTFVVEAIKAFITFIEKVTELLEDTYGECPTKSLNDFKTDFVEWSHKAWNWVCRPFSYAYDSTTALALVPCSPQKNAEIGTIISDSYQVLSKIVNDSIADIHTYIGNITTSTPHILSIDYLFIDDEIEPSRGRVLTPAKPTPTLSSLQANFFTQNEEFTAIDSSFPKFFIAEEEFTVLKPRNQNLPELPANWQKLPKYKLLAICTSVNKIIPKTISGHRSKNITTKQIIDKISQAYAHYD